MATHESVRTRKPASVIVIPVSAFAEDWEHRPTAPIAVGLRLLSELDAQGATRDAARTTVEFFHLGEPGATRPSQDVQNDVYVSRIMGFAIARAICDPNDIHRMHDQLPALEDHVFRDFTPDGIKHVFQQLQLATAKVSPLSPVADASDVALLVVHLRAETIAKLPRAEQLAVLRLLGCALETLRAAAPDLSVGDSDGDSEAEDGEDDGESDYEIAVRA